MYSSWDMVRDGRTDRGTDGKWYIEVGAPPKKILLIKNNFVLQSSKHKEATFPYVFLFVFILYFIGAILPKNIAKVGGWKKVM